MRRASSSCRFTLHFRGVVGRAVVVALASWVAREPGVAAQVLLPAAERAAGQRCVGADTTGAADTLPGCDDGVANDDGSLEDGIYSRGLVTRFSGLAAGTELDAVCVCWSIISGAPDEIEYDLVMYAADGPAGAPGTELARLPVTDAGLTSDGAFFRHDVGGEGFTVPSGPFYLGMSNDWASSKAFVCTDLDGSTSEPSYSDQGDWTQLGETPMIRPTPAAVDTCVPGPTMLCVDDQPDDRRFAVSVTYDTVLGGGASGAGRARSLGALGIADGGVFSFTDPSNPEMLVKVLDGCGINGHWWVFAAATTTVGYQLRVVDTETGLSRTFGNADRHAAVPVVETSAFACP